MENALADAGLEAKDIDGIWIGACSPSLFVNQEHVAPLGLEVAPEAMGFIPANRTEGACASSSVALYNAAWAVESGRFKRVLVIGVESGISAPLLPRQAHIQTVRQSAQPLFVAMPVTLAITLSRLITCKKLGARFGHRVTLLPFFLEV